MSDSAIGAKRPELLRSADTTPVISKATGPAPLQPNGTIAIGVGRSMPFVISTLSCALAVPPNESPSNAISARPPNRHENALFLTAPSITTPIDYVLFIRSRAPRGDFVRAYC